MWFGAATAPWGHQHGCTGFILDKVEPERTAYKIYNIFTFYLQKKN